MRQFFLSIAITLTLVVNLFAAYPYDSVAEITTPHRGGHNGGSCTLIAVSETKALVLSCQHVVLAAGKPVEISWRATGEVTQGTVIAVGANGLDIALCITDRPKDLRPVPLARANKDSSGVITNAGYPGLTGTLEWQQGDIQEIDDDELYYSCRPIPGMSGGATFDKYGNLIGVIVAYTMDGGISTSGADMTAFLQPYVNGKTSAWVIEPLIFPDLIVEAPSETKIDAPQDFRAFEAWVWITYILPNLYEDAIETFWPDTSYQPTFNHDHEGRRLLLVRREQ